MLIQIYGDSYVGGLARVAFRWAVRRLYDKKAYFYSGYLEFLLIFYNEDIKELVLILKWILMSQN